MPAYRCSECDQTHQFSCKIKQAGSKCIYHDPDTRVDRRLRGHCGLPNDCPGCLAHGTIEQRAYGRRVDRAGRPLDYKLTCSSCRAVYFWSMRQGMVLPPLPPALKG
jgi:hypothetical protein